MLTVTQAMEKFKQAEVPQNEEVLRRWLRKGKIEGAVIHSKKEGWLNLDKAPIIFILKAFSVTQ